jgi:hypothetical protein
MQQLSQTDIVNLALMQLGQGKIQSLTNQNDPNAVAALVAWNQAFGSVARETPWNCLKAPAILGQAIIPVTWTPPNTNIPSTATTWAPGTAYAVNAYVIFAGYLYQCLIANTSSGNFTVDLTRGYWFQTTTFSPNFFGPYPGNASPAAGWLYGYTLPPDFIALVRMNNFNCWGGWGWGYGWGGAGGGGGGIFGGRSHEIFGRILYTNSANASIVYIQYQTDTTVYDSLFTDALVLKLAAMIATHLRKDNAELSMRLGQMYERVLAEARVKNAGDDRLKRFNPVARSRFVRSRWQSTNG